MKSSRLLKNFPCRKHVIKVDVKELKIVDISDSLVTSFPFSRLSTESLRRIFSLLVVLVVTY